MTNGLSEPYSIDFTSAAEKDLARIPNTHVRRIAKKIAALGLNPRPSGYKKLSGEHALYRVRVGDYRVVYAINDASRSVTIARIRNRRDVYDNL